MNRLLKSFVSPLIATLALICTGTATAGPKIEHWQIANGARVYFVAAPQLPMVDIRVIFDAGSARDAGKGGVSQLTNGLLNEGAGGLDADQIAQRFEGVGAIYSNSAQRDMSAVSFRSLTNPGLLQPALETLALLLKNPSFPEQAFERERKRMLISLQGQRESAEDIADKAFFNTIYGDHPYSADPLGTEESVKALTREDVTDFHRRYYVGRNAIIAIVGAVNRAGAESIANSVVGDLPAGEAAPALPPVPELKEARTIRIPFPSAQTHILVGQPGMYRGDPDEFPLYVGNHSLGGNGLVSRLSEEIREKRGLSYSTYSYFIPMRVTGPYTAGLQTRNDQAEQAVKVLMDTLRDFAKQGPTADEINKSKLNITGGFPLRIESNSKTVEYLAMMGFYGLPLDYLDTYVRKVEALTRPQIQDAFARRIHPERMVTVIVGGAVKADPAP